MVLAFDFELLADYSRWSERAHRVVDARVLAFVRDRLASFVSDDHHPASQLASREVWPVTRGIADEIRLRRGDYGRVAPA